MPELAALPACPQGEAVLLRRARAGLHEHDLSGLLVSSWQHRACWTAMRSGPFEDGLCASLCAKLRGHESWVPGQCAAWSVWQEIERLAGDEGVGEHVPNYGWLCALPDCERPYGHPPHAAPTDYWLSELQECVASREIIQTAQAMAEYGWKRDSAGARRVAARAVRVSATSAATTPEPSEPTLEDLLAGA